MRFMAIVKATKQSEAGVMPTEEQLKAMGNFNEEMVKAGIMLAGEGLHPSSAAARICYPSGGKPSVVDGPFTETKELVAGFWLLQCKSKEEAIEWLKRAPMSVGLPPGEVPEVELRQVFDAADFGAELTPELRAQEDRMRAQVASQQAGKGAVRGA